MTDTQSTTDDDAADSSTDDEAANASTEDGTSPLEGATYGRSIDSSGADSSGDATTGDATIDDGTAGDESVTLERGSDAFGPESEVRRYLAWGGLGVCSLVALVGLFQFYGSVAAVIDIWVASKYEPMARAAFNLAVLLFGIAGVSWSVRELSSNSRP